jgi:hypothetical protein
MMFKQHLIVEVLPLNNRPIFSLSIVVRIGSESLPSKNSEGGEEASMNWNVVLYGFLATIAAVSAAHSNGGVVQLIKAEGKVLISRGSGYEAADAGAVLKTGDNLFVATEASATILYMADDCKWEVQPGSVLVVELTSPCQAKAFAPVGASIAVPGLLAGGATAAAGGGIVAASGALSSIQDSEEQSVTP